MLKSKGKSSRSDDLGRRALERRYFAAGTGGGDEAGGVGVDFESPGAELLGGTVGGTAPEGLSAGGADGLSGVADPALSLFAPPSALPPLVVDDVPEVLGVPVLLLPGTMGEVAVVLVLELPAPGAPANPVAGVESILTAVMHSNIQKAATPMVIRVNRSPAFAPNALWPPMPPSAPANPPPRPRWSSTIRIKKQAVTTKKNPKMKCITRLS
jgi:hypothetical protein